MVRRIAIIAFSAVLALILVVATFVLVAQITPWPGAMVVRAVFDFDGARRSQLLRPHVPDGVASMRDVSYDPADPDALLDVYFPAETSAPLPAVVWVHGGAWVAGGRAQMAEYASILAATGYAVVVVGYTLAPEATYPVALRQVARSLTFLEAEGETLHVDATRIVLAGDSAGAQIAAQLANAITAPDYAAAIDILPSMAPEHLRGTVLFAGAYDMQLVTFQGVIGFFLKSALWAYTGSPDFKTEDRFRPASVLHYVSGRFPPSFISAGAADPLLAHSRALADALAALGVEIDGLFFDDGRFPDLGHNYQFDLDTEAGRIALTRLGAFLQRHLTPSQLGVASSKSIATVPPAA